MIISDKEGNRHLGVPIKFEDEPSLPQLRAPELGEDSADILKELGYKNSLIESMAKQKVIKLG